MIEITAEVRAVIDRAARDMELAGDEYTEPADQRVAEGRAAKAVAKEIVSKR